MCTSESPPKPLPDFVRTQEWQRRTFAQESTNGGRLRRYVGDISLAAWTRF